MPEPRTIRVFLSAVSDEFRAYRDQLRSNLTRPNVEVKVQEDFKDLGGTTLEKLDDYIKACDAVVHLAGDMTGAYGIPGLPALLLRFMPAETAVPGFDRSWMVLVPTLQIFVVPYLASRPRRCSPGASFSMSCRWLVSICSGYVRGSPVATCRRRFFSYSASSIGIIQ